MCTLLVAARVVPDRPFVVVANRDERLGRASSPPLAWTEGAEPFVAPRDDAAGGTWLGVNAHGVVVGITNRHRGPNDASRVSRGTLVKEALALPSARAIHEAMAKVPPSRHNGFHLVYVDANDVLATFSDGDHLAQVVLGDGVHAITERSFGAGDDRPRLARIFEAWSRAIEGPFAPSRLERVLTDHDEADPFAATCIHIPGFDYGTRSSAVLVASNAPPDRWSMAWAEGPPCTTPFTPVDLSSLGKTS
jgi:uncharacterized protein with NRDE domain